MPRIFISDLDDPRIAVYRSLKASNETRRLHQFVVEGQKLVERLLKSPFAVASVLVADRFVDTLTVGISREIPIYVVPFSLIHQIVGFPFHRGILASGFRQPWPDAERIVGEAGGPITLAVCPKIGNPENLGAIARISDVLGVRALLAGPNCPDPFSRRVLRVSMGSALRLPIVATDGLEDLADRLAVRHGFEFWAAVADPSAPSFQQVERPDRLALVLGDEDQGVSETWLKRCHRAITIPMRSAGDSLNVSVAAGILLYHLTSGSPQSDS
jgi:tRNA G18 (ribose-2'-O)-methylase SpoU